MFTTLVAVVAALVLGHVAPAPVASLRRFHWWARWLDWIGTHAGEGGFWQGRSGLWLALLPPVLLVLLLQVLLHDRLWGLLGLLFGVVVLVCAWGPRDLDIDVEAALDTSDPESRGARLAQLAPEPGVAMTEDALLPGSLMRSALRRWFAPLFWFLLLGPLGAVLYRLLVQSVHGPIAAGVAAEARGTGAWALAVLEWPVAQLMTLSMALVGNFDLVFRAWRAAGGDRWQVQSGFLEAAGRAAVRGELAEEAEDYLREGEPMPFAGDLVELRDAMSLVWRTLVAWLAVIALFVIAGWVS